MKAIQLAAAVTACAFLFTSCEKEIDGSGHYITQTRDVNDFTGIESSGDYKVILRESEQSYIQIYGEDNIIPYIETMVSGNQLRIFNRGHNTHFDDHGVIITVYTPALNRVSLQGSGEIVSEMVLASGDLNANLSGSGSIDLEMDVAFLETTLSGSGFIRLTGTAVKAEHTISGSGDIRGFGLASKDVTATISGSGNCFINVSDNLHAVISGSGDIIYTGNPQVSANISGSGTVRHN